MNSKNFSFNRLKIAKPLIDNITIDFNDRQIISAIINMAKTMGVKTIAEGVETIEQLAQLKSLGCHEIQGYVFSRPFSPDEFKEKYLKDYTSQQSTI
jgi:EAL domain-containing protein (putative c-di-GMP-specific phosphodiesterase class I)